MKILKKTFSLFILVFLLAGYALPAVFEGEMTPVDNEYYCPALLFELQKAKKSIYVIMFLASYYPQYPDSPTNKIIGEIIKARKRGLTTEVILEYSDRDSHVQTENLKTALLLTNSGVSVYFDPLEKTTHSKLIIIDGRIVFLGSANWTYSAVTKNNETSVMLESEGMADHYINYFDKIKQNCKIKYEKKITEVKPR
jgi:phosphatidylserine/phosphatidylglycerophosphate/cardiolipin synthase-like enzyme